MSIPYSRPEGLVLRIKRKAPPPERRLCFEGGDLIIALTDDPEEHLVLHAYVLSKASFFFEGALKHGWNRDAPTVPHPTTGEIVKVYTHYMSFDKDDLIFTLGAKAQSKNVPISRTYQHTYLSNCATGYLGRALSESYKYRVSDQAEYDAIREFRALFGLVYQDASFLDRLSYDSLANVVAVAEMYGMLDVAACQMRKHLLGRKGIWEDVRDFPRFHLALSIKLRCDDIYCDALRHIVGSGSDLTALRRVFKDGYLDYEQVLRLTKKRDALREKTDQLTKDLKSLTLARYFPYDGYEPEAELGLEVKTTYLMSKYEPHRSSLLDKSQDVARRIFMEWLNLHLCGKEHWTHVRENIDEYAPDGLFHRSSLRNACNLAIAAVQRDEPLTLFGHDATKDLTAHFFEDVEARTYGQAIVEDTLRVFVTRMAALAHPLIAPPNTPPILPCEDNVAFAYGKLERENASTDPHRPKQGVVDYADYVQSVAPERRCGGRYRSSRPASKNRTHLARYVSVSGNKVEVPMRAMNDDNCHYFTCVDVEPSDDSFWDEFDEWEVEGVVDASREWLEAIGLEGTEDDGS